MEQGQHHEAKVYRMVTDDHICPFGLKAKDLLERSGYDVNDHPLRSREETDAFKEQHEVKTTPQVFIDNKRIGGYDALRDYLGKSPAGQQGVSYVPVISLFGVAAAVALSLAYGVRGTVLTVDVVRFFLALSMALLAVQKLQDLESFSNRFITYDLLGRRMIRYAYVYPFAELAVSMGMLAGALPFLVGPLALFIGTVGAISVYKAVYVDKRELKCACVGGNSDVPLGFVSLTENLAMVGMGLWTLFTL